ncbi:acetyl-CoA synthetase-like protein [Hysterangium stoloniferum]|nr:acetyl-CoA synthetase-like protein [Hysterangium stoloniferum]
MAHILKSKYDIPIPTQDILTWLFDDPTHDVDAPLFINHDIPGEIFTTRTLITAVRRIARGMRDIAKLKKNDVVLLCAPSSMWYTPFLLGTIAAGCIFTGANPAYLEEELLHQLNDSAAKAIFVSPEKLEITLKCAKKLGISQDKIFLFAPERSSAGKFKTLSDIMAVGEMDWERMNTLEAVRNKIAILAYSSGTSLGRPKACELSHRNVVASVSAVNYNRDRGDDARRAKGLNVYRDVCLAFLPLFHILGQNAFCFVHVKRGHPIYVMANYDLPEFLNAIQKYRITHLVIAPPIAVQLAKSPLTAKYDLSSVKTIFSGGAPLSKECALQVDRILDPSGEVKITQGWGMSETSGPGALFNGEILDPDKLSVGHLIGNLDLRLVDDQEQDVMWEGNESAVGEILVRGPTVFRGYWNNPQATKDAFTQDGWFRTGDIARIGKGKQLYIIDRKKEMIKVKGFAVAPAELEDILLKHPDVADAAVIGVTRDYQEQPRAYVVPSNPHADPKAIATFLASQVVSYKHLSGGIVFIDVIPKNAAGKILRRLLRDRAQAELGEKKEKARL